MPLSVGARLGPYEIAGLVGMGGMGEVYRARDPRLGRDVAIKILPSAFSADPERLHRFEQEARAAAALNHPNILAVYDIGQERLRPARGASLRDAEGEASGGGVPASIEEVGSPYIVSELLDGATLRERLQQAPAASRAAGVPAPEQSPLPVRKAIEYAVQICHGLAAAHEKGITHRDLKPENLFVTTDGRVKILDFGLAKLTQPEAGLAGASALPTTPAIGYGQVHTEPGMVLGTVGYMAPEQVRGLHADHRSDLFAFGAILYEMLSGQRAFRGSTAMDAMTAILKEDPPALPTTDRHIPQPLAHIVNRCLEKEPGSRFQSTRDLAFALESLSTVSDSGAAASVVAARKSPLSNVRLAWSVAAILLVALVAAAIWAMGDATPAERESVVTRLEVVAPPLSGDTLSFALSPDGRRLAFVVGDEIWVRTLDRLEPTVLKGLGMPSRPFFSPDGQWIGYFDGLTALKKVHATGGSPVTIGLVNGGEGRADWGPDDTIIFSTNDPTSGLWRVGAAGGEPELLTTPSKEQDELDHIRPQVLPGGETVLFTIATPGGTDDQIAVLDVQTRKRKVLIRGGSDARYVPTGHLVYGVAGTLRAVGFDVARLEVAGTPVPVVEGVATVNTGEVISSVSENGTLVYVPAGAQGTTRTLVWVDRQGLETPLGAPPREYVFPRLSPDGTRVALDAREPGLERDIWIWDLAREKLTRVTFEATADRYPVWTPDGQRVAFASVRRGAANVFWQAADGTGSVEQLTESPNIQYPSAFSPDGTRLVIREDMQATGNDLSVLSLQGERKVEAVLQTTFNELNGEISPDGRWLAYQSNESGQDEIYVRPFPDVTTGRWQITTGGGRQPLWARRGQELFFLGPTGALMSVAVETGTTFSAGNPVRLFEGPYYRGGSNVPGRTYDVSPDGKRFLMIKVDEPPRTIVVVLNWTEELKRLVPTK